MHLNKNKTKSSKYKVITAACLFICFVINTAIAKDFVVKTQSEYVKAVNSLKAGDTIVLANGEWSDFEIELTGVGAADNPITLTAQTKGKVIITGRSNLRLAGKYLVVSGLVFKHGHSPRGPVISFRNDNGVSAYHSRVTEVVIEGFSKPERASQDTWVALSGKHNRFDHNFIAGKSNRGVTLGVQLFSRNGSGKENLENHHRIDHNYFGPRPVLGANGGETIRIGNSWNSLHDSLTTVENNYFDRRDGEVEVISNKSSGNVYRGNVFFESRGTLTLRHGNNNLVENNVFLGNGVPHTGGIRVINKNQTIRNNYMYGLTGYRLGGGFVIMNGIYNSPINRYHQVDNALIQNNSIIDVDAIELGAGSDEERSAPPVNSIFSHNLVFNANGKDNFKKHDDISGIKFTNNTIHKNITLKKAKNGLLYPSDSTLANVGVSKDLKVLDKSATGPSWYAKPGKLNRFSGGKTLKAKPGLNTLADVVLHASAGDVIELAAGDYVTSATITVAKPVTIRGNGKAKITSERMALFDLVEGGSLKLDGVTITAESGARNRGNTIVRTVSWSVVSNYELIVENSTIENLDSGANFSFFNAGKFTFADKVEIRNSKFKDISGTVIKMNSENDDRGYYNGEYVTIADSTFENVGAIADIYRCCTDESTFGPHVSITGSEAIEVGSDKDAVAASIKLLGVQVINIQGNNFKNSTPIQVKETVGEPITVINNNNFENTPKPDVISIVGMHESMYKL
ncbi:chondroitinase-B domain-containing protein [Paraglaciecola sp.]|uniref:polysaccharide lyase 6 family protein n=1 Tax=Paraglaciecola sp. TaxID=1920173 RepID=UPI003EF7FE50